MEILDVLPVDISVHIFSLLPVESVLDYALVTKSWKNFIHSPSFYTMHIHRLMHLAKEAETERNKKIKECVEYTKSVTQFLQTAKEAETERNKKIKECVEYTKSVTQFLQTGLSKEQLIQIRENIQEKRNSMQLADEKRSNILRLASKCVEKCKHCLSLIAVKKQKVAEEEAETQENIVLPDAEKNSLVRNIRMEQMLTEETRAQMQEEFDNQTPGVYVLSS